MPGGEVWRRGGCPTCRAGGGAGVPTPTYRAQNDPHVVLIILTTHMWGENFWWTKLFQAKICVPAPLAPTTIVTQNKVPGTEAHFSNPPPPRAVLNGEKKKCSVAQFSRKNPRAHHVLVVGCWRQLAAVGGWGLVVDGGWRWLAVGRRWRLAIGGWRLAVDDPLGRSLRAVLHKKKSSPLTTPLPPPAIFRSPLLGRAGGQSGGGGGGTFQVSASLTHFITCVGFHQSLYKICQTQRSNAGGLDRQIL